MTPSTPHPLHRVARALLLATTLAATSAAFLASPASAQPAAPPAQPAAPATRPAAPQPTAEQRALIEANRNQPSDVPAPKLSLNAFNRDGTPNPNFGKPDPNFLRRHDEFLKRSKEPAQVVFIGDSITDWWSREPELWNATFGKYQPANFGIAGDRTQHVLWRIENGELDAFQANPPKVAVVMIGTNNNLKPADEIARGTTAVVRAIQAKLPTTKVLLLSIFPREEKPTGALRQKMKAANAILKTLDDGNKVKYLELWDQFLTVDGTLTKDIMPDGLHPNSKGYQIWADAMKPVLDEMMK